LLQLKNIDGYCVINLELIQTIKILVALILAYLLISGIAGAFQAWVADKMGDSTARDIGMMSINPFVHVDPVSLIIMPLGFLWAGIVIGLSRPIPIIWHHIRSPLRWIKLGILALAQPLAILGLLVILLLLSLLSHAIFVALKWDVATMLHAYRYILEAVMRFSAWFIPYQLLMSLAQISMYELEKRRAFAGWVRIAMLVFLPLFGALMLWQPFWVLIVKFVLYASIALQSGLKIVGLG